MVEVLFEDNHLLVLAKPANIPTQPALLNPTSLEIQGKEWLKNKYQKKGNIFLHAIHRLDKPVSGVVVFAKTSKALSRLQASFRNKECRKIYLAWIEGILEAEADTLEDYLVHGDHQALKAGISDPEAKLCRLHYRKIVAKNQRTLIKIELETGRYHQIRAQFGFRGYPVVGDKKYGSKQLFQQGRIALHHYRFTIKHPTLGTVITFAAPPRGLIEEEEAWLLGQIQELETPPEHD